MRPEIHFSPAARRELLKLPREVQEQVFEVVEALRSVPRPHGVEKLADQPSFLRLQINDDWRLIYHLRGNRLIVVLLLINRLQEEEHVPHVAGELTLAISEIAESKFGLKWLAST